MCSINRHKGFSLIELITVISLLGILSVFALSKFYDFSSRARINLLLSLQGSVVSAAHQIHAAALVTNAIQHGSNGNDYITVSGVVVRLWNGWPDRWWDGIGISLEGATPTSGGYLSTAAFTYNQFTFYGYGNTALPNGSSGWRIETAPDPLNCSVAYINDGSGNTPTIVVYNSGC